MIHKSIDKRITPRELHSILCIAQFYLVYPKLQVMDLHLPTPFIVFANFTSVLTRQTRIHLRTSFVCSQINLSFEKFLDIFLYDITVPKIIEKFTLSPPQTTSRLASLADFFLFFPQCGAWFQARWKYFQRLSLNLKFHNLKINSAPGQTNENIMQQKLDLKLDTQKP